MAAAAEAEEFAEQDMRLAERGKMAPPEHVATRDGDSLISVRRSPKPDGCPHRLFLSPPR